MGGRGRLLFMDRTKFARIPTVIQRWRVTKGIVSLMVISTIILYKLISLALTPKWKIVDQQKYSSSNPKEEYYYTYDLDIAKDQISERNTTALNNYKSNKTAREIISVTNSNVSTVLSSPRTATTPKTIRPTMSYEERFQFIHKNEKISLHGPIYNTIPARVTWREELADINICDSKEPFILAVVITAIKNKQKRDTVRKTWANETLYPRTGIRAVFVLGATINKTLQDEVAIESKKYRDIIQYNFIDSYGNLTYKTMAWLKWVNKHCPEVPFVAKIDDDVIVNPFTLKKYLLEELKKTKIYSSEDIVSSKKILQRPELANPATNFIYGKLHPKSGPHRGGKWGVSKETYPDDFFPPFVLGPAYILGGNVVGRLLEYAPYTPLLWLEDVYTTGLVAQAAQVKHVQATPIFITRGSSDNGLYDGKKAFWVEHGLKDKSSIWSNIMKYS